MATPKELRASPPKKLDNYVASIQKLFGDPNTTPDKNFISGKKPITWEWVSLGNDPSDGYSVVEPIGFEIEINGKIYKEFSVASCGWMMLRDPEGGSTGTYFYNDIIKDDDFGNDKIYTNEFIKSNFLHDHILLAPWFDANFMTAQTVDELSSVYYNAKISPTVADDIAAGKDNRNWPYDPLDSGIRYVNGYDKNGKYLLVRWTLSQYNYNNRIKFEIALYENGKIEYRYWPIEKYESSDYASLASRATVGIFWSGPADENIDKFRDFSVLFDYIKNQRTISEYGASEYDAGFYETSDSYAWSIKPYALNVPYENWPKNGAIITFSPPVNPVKILTKRTIGDISNTREIIRKPGLFNDRKILNFSSVTNRKAHMPSLLPSRLTGEGAIDIGSRLSLFTSDSLKVMSSSFSNDIIDNFLLALDAKEKLDNPVDLSFNEYEKEYTATSEVSSFYTTGSAPELFGLGFSSPLKSKTQFNFSLPVNKTITLPNSSPSLHYYDASRKTWAMIDPNGYIGPESIVDIGGNTDKTFYYRITETSRAFDAVGRKIISGSSLVDKNLLTAPGYPNGYPLSLQTDIVIGSLFNHSSGSGEVQNIINDAISKKYTKSTTDNPDFYPKKSQMLDMNLEYPFLIEKIIVNLPFYARGDWFSDFTTCTRPFGDNDYIKYMPAGPMDFGGPALTFALFCPRKGVGNSYMDLIASGTITHNFDNKSKVILKKELTGGTPASTYYHSLRPEGFKAFSNPTAVVEGKLDGSEYFFDGNVRLQMEASIAGGVSFARNDRSLRTDTASHVTSNRNQAITLLTTPVFSVKSEKLYNDKDSSSNATDYATRSPRVHIQQISPLSRGSSGFEFNGNSILGGNIASYNTEDNVKNPLYVGDSLSTSDYLIKITTDSQFKFDAVSVYSTADSQPAPYLVMPGDKLTLAISKTRPVIKETRYVRQVPGGGPFKEFNNYLLTGSHGTVQLSTGSINITIYGSYVRNGVEYNP